MNSLGLEYFLEIYEKIREAHPTMSEHDAIEATKAAIYYEISRDWLAMANRELH